MFARVTVVDGPPGQFDKARQLITTHARAKDAWTAGTPGHLLAWRPEDGKGDGGCAV
jgi:hypothetical protein